MSCAFVCESIRAFLAAAVTLTGHCLFVFTCHALTNILNLDDTECEELLIRYPYRITCIPATK